MEAATLKHSNDNKQKSNPANGGAFFKPVIQAKLSINEPGDNYEREADAMADKVMRMTDTTVNQNAFCKSAHHTVQRKCAACEEEGKHIHRKENGNIEIQKKDDLQSQAGSLSSLQMSGSIANLNAFFKPSNNTIQRKCQACEEEKHVHRKESSTDEVHGGNELQNYVSSLSSSGQQMPETSRSFFESRFGHDFSGVKIHTDTVAAKSAQSINALAYTTGNNIVFNSGQYAPDNDSGKRLIAHELTHVIQQGSGMSPKVQRMGDLTKVPPMACAVANSSPSPSVLSSQFPLSSFTLTGAQRTNIANFVASWRASGGTDQLRVDGYASTPGTDEMNWQLSCNRALSVANELRNNGVPDSSITIFAQGEISEFGAQANNQTANISMSGAVAPPAPPVSPAPVPPAPAPATPCPLGITGQNQVDHYCAAYVPSDAANCGTFPAPNLVLTATGMAAGAALTWDISQGGTKAAIDGPNNGTIAAIKGNAASAATGDVIVRVSNGTCSATKAITVREPTNMTATEAPNNVPPNHIEDLITYTVKDQFNVAMGAGICVDETITVCHNSVAGANFTFGDAGTDVNGQVQDHLQGDFAAGVPANLCVKLNQTITAGGCGPLLRNTILYRPTGISLVHGTSCAAGDACP